MSCRADAAPRGARRARAEADAPRAGPSWCAAAAAAALAAVALSAGDAHAAAKAGAADPTPAAAAAVAEGEPTLVQKVGKSLRKVVPRLPTNFAQRLNNLTTSAEFERDCRTAFNLYKSPKPEMKNGKKVEVIRTDQVEAAYHAAFGIVLHELPGKHQVAVPDEEAVRKILRTYDVNGDGSLDYGEFKSMVVTIMKKLGASQYKLKLITFASLLVNIVTLRSKINKAVTSAEASILKLPKALQLPPVFILFGILKKIFPPPPEQGGEEGGSGKPDVVASW